MVNSNKGERDHEVVKPAGISGRIYLPKAGIGKKVKTILMEVKK